MHPKHVKPFGQGFCHTASEFFPGVIDGRYSSTSKKFFQYFKFTQLPGGNYSL